VLIDEVKRVQMSSTTSTDGHKLVVGVSSMGEEIFEVTTASSTDLNSLMLIGRDLKSIDPLPGSPLNVLDVFSMLQINSLGLDILGPI